METASGKTVRWNFEIGKEEKGKRYFDSSADSASCGNDFAPISVFTP